MKKKKFIKNGFNRRFKNVTFKFFSFAMIYIIHKMLVLLKNHLNYLKDKILECFFIKYNRLLFFLKKLFVFIIYNDEKSKS